MAQPHRTHSTTATRAAITLGILAATLAALAGPTPTDTTASNRETGTVKWITESKSAGEKKVEVIK